MGTSARPRRGRTPAVVSMPRSSKPSKETGSNRVSQHPPWLIERATGHPRICFANPHRLRPPAGVLARSLQTLRVCLTLAPCAEFDPPRYLYVIKKQVETLLYLLVTIGGGAENRTPVHESPLIGISKLSRWFSLGRFARSDTLAASQPVRS